MTEGVGTKWIIDNGDVVDSEWYEDFEPGDIAMLTIVGTRIISMYTYPGLNAGRA